MRAVLDTVVFLRALMNRRGQWGYLLFDLRRHYTLVLSPDVIEEVVEVLNRSGLARRLPPAGDVQWDEVIDILMEADIVDPSVKLMVSRDIADNKFFECAVEGGADYIISEDRDILDIGEFQGVQTVTAAQFIELLESVR